MHTHEKTGWQTFTGTERCYIKYDITSEWTI